MREDPIVMAARTTVQELRDFVAWDTAEIEEAAGVLEDALDHLGRELKAAVEFRHEREDQLIQELNRCGTTIVRLRYALDRAFRVLRSVGYESAADEVLDLLRG